jgi:hypothetical protein
MDARTDKTAAANAEEAGRTIALSFLERRGYEDVRGREEGDGCV